jgi:hypothetical protein
VQTTIMLGVLSTDVIAYAKSLLRPQSGLHIVSILRLQGIADRMSCTGSILYFLICKPSQADSEPVMCPCIKRTEKGLWGIRPLEKTKN